jgi:hypothetical protein
VDIFLSVAITFILTILWQKWATRKNKLPLRVTIQGMMNELNTLAKKSGYQDVTDYWEREKGTDYMTVAIMNYQNALNSLH